MDKIIITAAITGSIHTPSLSPYLPSTPEEIKEDAVKAAEAGAAVVHIHARDEKGMPTSDLDVFEKILKGIKEESNVIICPTTGGGLGMSVEERVKIVPELKPEMATFNMGSMNFALYPMIERIEEPKHDWEIPYLEKSKDFVFKNTFADLEYISRTMNENDTKPELEFYDVGQIYNAAQLVRQEDLDLPIHGQFVLGVLGGIGTHPEDLLHMKRTADRLFGKEYTWSCIGVGRHELRLIAQAVGMGGHVRVGMEDNLWVGKGKLAESNADLVEKAKTILEGLGKEAASPDEARDMLGLKGLDKVNF